MSKNSSRSRKVKVKRRARRQVPGFVKFELRKLHEKVQIMEEVAKKEELSAESKLVMCES